jgi:RNA polymerase sigma factor (sigma-70 family)
MQELDDNALLREYAERGSETAFAALVSRHVDKVYSVGLRHTGNPHQAEEITQAVFVILAQKSCRLGNRVILEGWLHHTARLTALASIRSETRRARREQKAYMQSTLDGNEPDIWPQIAPVLDTAIAGLNETDRHAVVLRFMYGKSMKEVGAVLGGSEGAARLRLHRATEKLRQFFYKRGIVSTTEIIAGAISANAVQFAPVGLAKTVTALALAQGPAVASSTLTLIKGALKIMAWTKAKTAIVTGAAVLLAAGTTPIIIKEIRNLAHSPSSPNPRTTAATESIKGQLLQVGQLVDAGNTTPEAAWETRYWARSMGDYDAVIAGTAPQAVATAKAWMGPKATFHTRSQEDFTSLSGFQILARKDLGTDKVELKYQFGFGNGPTSQQTKIVVMVKANGAWRCAQTRPFDASWDTDSQPEPQPTNPRQPGSSYLGSSPT